MPLGSVPSTKTLGGGQLVFQAGYHSHKRIFKTHPINTYFSGMKNPKYAFLYLFFLISRHGLSKICQYDQKPALFSKFAHFCIPNDVRAYIVWSWKTTLITWIFWWWYPTSKKQINNKISYNHRNHEIGLCGVIKQKQSEVGQIQFHFLTNGMHHFHSYIL